MCRVVPGVVAVGALQLALGVHIPGTAAGPALLARLTPDALMRCEATTWPVVAVCGWPRSQAFRAQRLLVAPAGCTWPWQAAQLALVGSWMPRRSAVTSPSAVKAARFQAQPLCAGLHDAQAGQGWPCWHRRSGPRAYGRLAGGQVRGAPGGTGSSSSPWCRNRTISKRTGFAGWPCSAARLRDRRHLGAQRDQRLGRCARWWPDRRPPHARH